MAAAGSKIIFPQIKTARFFDLGRNMVLAHAIPTNVSRKKLWTLHQQKLPHKKGLAFRAHRIIPIHPLENSVRRMAPEIHYMMRQMVLLSHTRNPCFQFSHFLEKKRGEQKWRIIDLCNPPHKLLLALSILRILWIHYLEIIFIRNNLYIQLMMSEMMIRTKVERQWIIDRQKPPHKLLLALSI